MPRAGDRLTRERLAEPLLIGKPRFPSPKDARRRGAWERGAVVLLLVFVLIPSGASGQERLAPGQDAPAKFVGRIFLGSYRGQDAAHRGIVALDPNDGTWSKVLDRTPGWPLARVSPDGSRLAFSRIANDEVDPGLWIYGTTGNQDSYRASERKGFPCWAPDGKSILVSVSKQGVAEEHWRIDVDGSHEERLALPAGETVVDWTSDGIWLLTSHRRKNTYPGSFPLSVIHPDGSDMRPLSATHIPGNGGASSNQRFSPDGKNVLLDQVTFGGVIPDENGRMTRRQGETSSLWVLDVNGDGSRRFLDGNYEDGHPTRYACWSPDGKVIAVIRFERDVNSPVVKFNRHVEIVDLMGKTLKKYPVPEETFFNLIDWR